MKGIFVDCGVIDQGDIDWSPFDELLELDRRAHTNPADLIATIGDSNVVLVDSAKLTREVLSGCPGLKFAGVAGTGTDNIDLEAAADLGIAVANVPAYSTDAVAQHAVALMLALTNKVCRFADKVNVGLWGSPEAALPITLLKDKSIGIVGYGNIGRRTAEICTALGMIVNVYSRDRDKTMKSDIISLHCPLTKANARMVDESFINDMKKGAILINTARGGLLDEEAVARAVKDGRLAGVGADVLTREPPSNGSPMLGVENIIVTPHVAFTPVETRQEVIRVCAQNLKSYIEGGRLNRVDLPGDTI